MVAIYQASEAIVNLCDKIMVLYEGREVYFGTVTAASEYFEQMGWHRSTRQTTGDFLTMVTNPAQRTAKKGFENLVPRTPEEFEDRWHESPQHALLQTEIERHHEDLSGAEVTTLREFEQARGAMKAKRMLKKAPQTVSFWMQIGLCIKRAYWQFRNDKASTAMALVGEVILALVVGSMFYGTPANTSAFFSYGSVLFFSVLLNVLIAMTDCHSMYKGRLVIRKQVSYAFYRPSADALAVVLVDLPVKFVLAVAFNVILYFLAGLGLTAAQFFIFFLLVFTTTLAMSMVFRTIAAATKTLPQAMAICGLVILVLVTYTGFTLPGPYMHPWFKWISYINPLAYTFEALLVNQAHGTNYPCATLVPPYPDLTGDTFICPILGAVVGQTYVNGDDWFETAYGYSYLHLWRNFGIIMAYYFFFLATYLLATELNTAASESPDVLVFLRQSSAAASKPHYNADVEAGPVANSASSPAPRNDPMPFPQREETFSWENVSLEVKIGKESRSLLSNVSGWVRPGTLTALMGVSGAGKTTLLNALAHRSPSGTPKGEFYVAGIPISASFASGFGYVQQQDVHLETSTVREALQFSAMLRQPRNVPKKEKIAFVEEVIRLLDMGEFADAVIGVPGKGLNVEQRKRVSIGVELAAKPTSLLFLDEPTSGLDSQSSAAILSLLRRLAGGGLGILCTIHQPSAILFQEFDRVLLMAGGGRTVYFGDIGKDSQTVLRYFGDRGATKFVETENPADYVLRIIGGTAVDVEAHDWPRLWNESREAEEVSTELRRMVTARQEQGEGGPSETVRSRHGDSDSSTPLLLQIRTLIRRVFQFYWRSPTYIVSKFALAIFASLLVGFSFFQPGVSILGIQNAVFGVLLVCATFSALVQQVRTNGKERQTPCLGCNVANSTTDHPKIHASTSTV